IGLGLACGIVAFAWFARGDFNQWDGPLAIARCLPEFLLGSLLYTAMRRPAVARWLGSDGVAVGLLAAGVLLLHFGAPDLLNVALFGVIVLSLAANRGRVQALLDRRPLVRLGELSYALYLIHGFVEYLTTRMLASGSGSVHRSERGVTSSFALMVSMIAASLLLASYAYPHVEMRGRRALRDRLMARGRTRAGA